MREFYRYVSRAEYDDLKQCGRFRKGPNGARGKWFTNSRQGAEAWGEALESLESTPDDGCVVRFTVPDEDAENFHFMGRNYEGVADTWFATHEQLENASIELGDT